jgi:hypothetical protein
MECVLGKSTSYKSRERAEEDYQEVWQTVPDDEINRGIKPTGFAPQIFTFVLLMSSLLHAEFPSKACLFSPNRKGYYLAETAMSGWLQISKQR